MSSLLLTAVLAVVLLGLEASVSMAEAAFFSISRLTLERLKSGVPVSGTRTRHRIALIECLLARPAQLLGSILITDMLISVALSTAVAVLAQQAAYRYHLPEPLTVLVGTLVLFILLLTAGETIPKLIALRSPLRVAGGFASAWSVADRLLAPMSRVLDRWAGRVLRQAKPVPFPTEAELKTMLEVGRERGILKGAEEEILWNIAELGKRTVSEIMTPRIGIQAVRSDVTVGQAMELARRSMHSRFPVYGESIDQIVGMFYIKDFLRVADPSAPVLSASREPYLIPESKKIPALLDEFRRLGIHVAAVVDEFGQTAGLVTLEDVLEALFGEIRDEYDVAEELPLVKLPDGSYSVDGDVDLKTLNRLFRHVFRGQEFERLSGFIHHMLGRLPETGDRFDFRGLRFELAEVHHNQIGRVSIRRIRDREPGTQSQGAGQGADAGSQGPK